MGIPWKRILVACVAAAALTACSGGDTGATTQRADTPDTVTLLPEKDDSKKGQTIQVGANTVSCSQNAGAIPLRVPGVKKGFGSNLIKVDVQANETIIDWDNGGASAIVVNDQNWANAEGNKTPMPAKTKLSHDKWGKPTKIVICGFGN